MDQKRLLVMLAGEQERQGQKLSCPLSSITILSLYKYLSSHYKLNNCEVIIETIPPQSEIQKHLFKVDFKADITRAEFKHTPVQLPAAIHTETIQNIENECVFAGLAGVCRLITSQFDTGQSIPDSKIHPHGILGFKGSCLQAPNETSVWTKFCEIELPLAIEGLLRRIKTAKCLLPTDIVRFENHLGLPPRIHNYEKVIQNLATQSKAEEIEPTKPTRNSDEDLSDKSPRITVKNRKWKSNRKHVNASKENTLKHEFAEGPFITLADFLLYPAYYIFFTHFKNTNAQSLLPKTTAWFNNLRNLEHIRLFNDILETISCTVDEVDVEFALPDVENVSLYKSDPKRSNPRKRLFTKEGDILDAMNYVADDLKLPIVERSTPTIDWNTVPSEANTRGHLPDKREERKSQQLENLASAVINIAKKGDRIVDFCSGCGHLGILLAYFLPECHIILLENKEQSLNQAKERVKKLQLKNVTFYQCNLDYFESDFDIGVSLHACGVATDLVLEKCIKAKASFVVCPCCYGSVHPTARLKYPKSAEFSHIPIKHYMCLGHAADQTHIGHSLEKRGSECMRIIDSDRGWHAISYGYSVFLTQLKPPNCSPKNMLLIGKLN